MNPSKIIILMKNTHQPQTHVLRCVRRVEPRADSKRAAPRAELRDEAQGHLCRADVVRGSDSAQLRILKVYVV